MATADQFQKAPPLRFELTEEPAAAIDANKPPGDAALVVGYARRHPWPDPNKFTLCAWFVTMPKAEAALMSAGIMGKTQKAKAQHSGFGTKNCPKLRRKRDTVPLKSEKGHSLCLRMLHNFLCNMCL